MWQELVQIALGELKLRPWEFDEYSMNEFVLAMKGLQNFKMDQWYHTRTLCYVIAKPYLKNKNTKMEVFWPLPGDRGKSNSKKVAAMNPEERRAAMKALSQLFIDQGIKSDN